MGKVRTVAHVLSPETGQAVTQFSLAISSVSGVGVTHADTPNTAPAGTSPGSTALTGSPTAVFNYGPSADHTITVTFPASRRQSATRPILRCPAVTARVCQRTF